MLCKVDSSFKTLHLSVRHSYKYVNFVIGKHAHEHVSVAKLPVVFKVQNICLGM